jgi:hypothetical protein
MVAVGAHGLLARRDASVESFLRKEVSVIPQENRTPGREN